MQASIHNPAHIDWTAVFDRNVIKKHTKKLVDWMGDNGPGEDAARAARIPLLYRGKPWVPGVWYHLVRKAAGSPPIRERHGEALAVIEAAGLPVLPLLPADPTQTARWLPLVRAGIEGRLPELRLTRKAAERLEGALNFYCEHGHVRVPTGHALSSLGWWIHSVKKEMTGSTVNSIVRTGMVRLGAFMPLGNEDIFEPLLPRCFDRLDEIFAPDRGATPVDSQVNSQVDSQVNSQVASPSMAAAPPSPDFHDAPPRQRAPSGSVTVPRRPHRLEGDPRAVGRSLPPAGVLES